jgi:hypothetical protein
MSKSLLRLSGLALLLAPLAVARADLVLAGPATVGGTGLGAVNTVLTIQNSPTEAGCVSYTPGGDLLGGSFNASGVCTGAGNDKTGASQTQTQLLSATGVTNATNFAIMFNIAEPGGDGMLTLNSLVANFYNAATGLRIGTQQACVSSCLLNTTFVQVGSGVGTSGYAFMLDADGISAIQSAINANGGLSNVRVGLSASAGAPVSSDGSNETFFVFNSAAVTASPEPSTTVFLATGFAGLVGMVRRRRRS